MMPTKLLHLSWFLVMFYHYVECGPLPDRPLVYPKTYAENQTRLDRDVTFPRIGVTTSLQPALDHSGNPRCLNAPSSTYCSKVVDYPTDGIRRLLKFDPAVFQDIFGVKGISTRRNIDRDDLSDEPVCRSRMELVYPKMAKNEDNKWRYVVNDVDYVQAVVTEVCGNEGSQCDYIQDSLPSGFTSICKQRFSYKKLVAIDPDKRKSYSDSFTFPSCCSCYVKVPPFIGRNRKNMGTSPVATGLK